MVPSRTSGTRNTRSLSFSKVVSNHPDGCRKSIEGPAKPESPKILRSKKIKFLRDIFLFLHVNFMGMNTKLTLNLNKDVIEEAKTYAKDHKVSLSKLIENYLNSLTTTKDKGRKVSPLVESLTGVIPSEASDDKKEYREFISKKYS